jgi:hypothetical protein
MEILQLWDAQSQAAATLEKFVDDLAKNIESNFVSISSTAVSTS